MALPRADLNERRRRAGRQVPEGGPRVPTSDSHPRERLQALCPAAVHEAPTDAGLHIGTAARLPIGTEPVY